jgi:signal transduction histidine kinase/ActR/RegA family two-component response regulator
MRTENQKAGIEFLNGGGQMGALMRAHDWEKSPLGAPAGWPAVLKSAIATCLNSRFPMVVWWGPELLMLYNDAWRPVLGETKHPAGLGRPGKESWPETWPVVGIQFDNALKGIASWSEDLLLASDRHGFMEESYFTYTHGPLKNASGEIVGVLSIVCETTARVLNERRLQALTQLSVDTVEATRRLDTLQAMTQLLVESLCRNNPDAPFAAQYVVESAHRVRRIAVARSVEDCLPVTIDISSDDPWGVAETFRSKTPVAVNKEISTRLSGGERPQTTTQLLCLPLFDAGRETTLGGVLLVGINSRLRLDTSYSEFLRLVASQFSAAIATLQFVRREHEARSDAQRAARMRDEFIATVSHELRNPLHAIIGWTQILKQAGDRPAHVAKAVEVIERNARLQARVVTDLLDISRALSGNLRLELRGVDIGAVIASAVESVTPAANAKGITINVTNEIVSRTVLGDAARIEQMLWNLLSNALKFTGAGGVVRIVTEADDQKVSVLVIDNGEGIDPAFLPHLFTRFRQADSSPARKHEGLGLGLAIVKQFADLHGGRISAQSDGPGCGATFVLELPRADVEGRKAVTKPKTSSSFTAPAQSGLNGVKVLVVEDQPDAMAVVERILEGAAAVVQTALCADEALRLLAGNRFDVIVSDVAMPGMDGYEFCAELARRGIDTPAIALTAFALPADASRAMAAGFKAHISKPIDRTTLLSTIIETLSSADVGSTRPGPANISRSSVSHPASARSQSK